MTLRFRVAVAAVAGLAAFGGSAALTAGTVPDSTGVFYACRTSSDLHLINYPARQCVAGEKLVHWSQAGPPGPVGPSDAFTTSATDVPNVNDSRVRVAHLSVPPGSYTLSAKAAFPAQAGLAGSFNVDCRLVVEGAGTILDQSGGSYPGSTTVVLPLLASVSFEEAGGLELRCGGYGGNNWSGVLTALRVGTLTVQAP